MQVMDGNCSIQLNGTCLEPTGTNEEIVKCETISDEEYQANVVGLQNSKTFGSITTNGTKIVECSLCFKLLKESSLKQHMKTHIGLKPYKCTICNSRFTRKGDVSRHATAIHGPQLPKFKCNTCSKWFSDAQLYSSHLKTHIKEPYFNCDLCFSKFAKKEYFADHVKYGNCYTKLDNLEVTNIYDSDFLRSVANEEHPKNSLISDSYLHLQSNEISNKNADPSYSSPLKHRLSTSLDSYYNNEIDSSSICKMKLSPAKISSSTTLNDCEHINNAIKTAVHQSVEVINSIQQTLGSNMTTMQNTTRSEDVNPNKQSSTELHIKALVDDKIQKISISLPLGITFDAATPLGMRAVLNIISELCSEKGSIEGEIDVKVVKRLK